MLVYRIKHLPTEMYYIPTRGRFSSDKTNLSKTGKVYITSKPSLEHIKHYTSISESQLKKFPNLTTTKGYDNGNRVPWNESDWKIMTYELVDKETRSNLLPYLSTSKDTKYLECTTCHETFRNRYRLEEYNAPEGYDYNKCPMCNDIVDERFK